MTRVSLYWPSYRLFPYEREFALTEIRALLKPRRQSWDDDAVTVDTLRVNAARRLTYFRAFQVAGRPEEPTTQHLIEAETARGSRRQSTRYSVHGLHEYKGKFNPQIARMLLNSMGLPRNARVLDPFCGSGTTLVECVHAGMQGVGSDINPLATMIANAKVEALTCEPSTLLDEANAVVRATRMRTVRVGRDARARYLLRWFEREVLEQLETLRIQLEKRERSIALILLVLVSDLLREFSLQEPEDLRIRRRRSPPSERDLYDAFLEKVASLVENVRIVQRHEHLSRAEVIVHHGDSTKVLGDGSAVSSGKFHAAITSPPYAMALPYIDTQRLSLVWLRLLAPDHLPSLQATLIGSREFNGSPRSTAEQRLSRNSDRLPSRHVALCKSLRAMVGAKDGFRRQAVPSLLYRYLAGMRNSLRTIRSVLRVGAPFFLIVGHNHTVLGGRRIDISTPQLLADLAETTGFAVQGHDVLQTYRRYGLHQKNAVAREELLTLRAL